MNRICINFPMGINHPIFDEINEKLTEHWESMMPEPYLTLFRLLEMDGKDHPRRRKRILEKVRSKRELIE